VQKIQPIKYKNHKAYELPQIRLKDPKENDTPIKDLWLMIEVRDEEYSFYYRFRYSQNYMKIGSTTFPGYRPKYFALASFRGMIPAGDIPAYFNFVRIEKCR
jgi:hypothetical protein